MKLAGQLLMTLGLTFGALAASTAYHVKVNYISSGDIEKGLTLNEDVVKKEGNDEFLLARKNDKVTQALLAEFQAEEIFVVRVKQFSFRRWTWSWVFFVSLLALGGGAWLVKRSVSQQAGAATGEGLDTESPEFALRATAADVDELMSRLKGTADREERLAMIVGGVENLQQTHLAAFVDARDKLTARYGIGGMAELMDEFSSAERSINRAWSAASDGDLDEAMDSLTAARPMLNGPLAKLQAK